MYAEWHCRHCGMKHDQKLSPFPKKKINIDVLLVKIRSYIGEKISKYKKEPVWKNSLVTKEEVAKHFRVKPHFVEQCFHKLNLEGLLNKPTHKAPHDSMRDYTFSYGYYKGKCCDYKNINGDSSWCADRYYINYKYLEY